MINHFVVINPLGLVGDNAGISHRVVIPHFRKINHTGDLINHGINQKRLIPFRGLITQVW